MARFRLKTAIVFDAVRVTDSGALWTEAGHMYKRKGDWVINGELVMTDKTFRSLFEPVDAEADALMDEEV